MFWQNKKNRFFGECLSILDILRKWLLKKELEYEDIEDHYWTDSEVVLGFISNESSCFYVYVANRVQLIHNNTTPSQRQYVDTASNIADEDSRSMSAKDFVEKSRWIAGPDFLKEPVDSWLKEETYEHDVDPDSPEVKNVRVNTSAVKESSDQYARDFGASPVGRKRRWL